MKNATILLVTAAMCCIPALAQRKKKEPLAPLPNEAELRSVYDMSAKQIIAQSRYPPSVRFQGIGSAWFVNFTQVKGNNVVKAYIVYDGQNGFGATVRGTAICSVNVVARVTICNSIDGDLVAMGMIPREAYRLPHVPSETAALKEFSSEPRPHQVEIEIDSNPSGAYAEIDGVSVGKTPIRTPVVVGEHTVKIVKPDFETWTEKIVAEDGKPRTVTASLKPSK